VRSRSRRCVCFQSRPTSFGFVLLALVLRADDEASWQAGKCLTLASCFIYADETEIPSTHQTDDSFDQVRQKSCSHGDTSSFIDST
jgi:hypothetical protein